MRARQAQKEFTVNEAIARIDMLLHPAIEGEADLPPGSPADGECWLVGSDPSGAWSGHAGELASFTLGTWLFAELRDGMRLLDKEIGQILLRRDGRWSAPNVPDAPTGGATVDAEARDAINVLIAILADNAILPSD